MCLICIEFNKGKLTVLEAFQNLSEMEETMPEEHYESVVEMLTKEWEAQSYYNAIEEQDDLTDDDIYDRIQEDEDESVWGYSEYGNEFDN